MFEKQYFECSVIECIFKQREEINNLEQSRNKKNEVSAGLSRLAKSIAPLSEFLEGGIFFMRWNCFCAPSLILSDDHKVIILSG